MQIISPRPLVLGPARTHGLQNLLATLVKTWGRMGSGYAGNSMDDLYDMVKENAFRLPPSATLT